MTSKLRSRHARPASQAKVATRTNRQRLEHQAWMLQDIAYFAADGNHNRRSGLDPPRVLSAEERASCLAVVRRIVATVESLPEPDDHRASLVASLGELGAFDEAIQLARRIDQKQIQGPDEIDAIWALWRVSLSSGESRVYSMQRGRLCVKRHEWTFHRTPTRRINDLVWRTVFSRRVTSTRS